MTPKKPLDRRAVIRINNDVWIAFKELCGNREASDVIRDFIEYCVEKKTLTCLNN